MLGNQVSHDRGIIVAWKEAKDGWKGTSEQPMNTLKLAVKWFWYKIGGRNNWYDAIEKRQMIRY